MSVVVSGRLTYKHKRRGSYRFGVQAAQNLNQRSVHFLRGSLEEFPTPSHKQCVTCKGGVTQHQDQARLLTAESEHTVPKGPALPSLFSPQLSRRHGLSQATLLPHAGSVLCKPTRQTQLLNTENPAASPRKPCQHFPTCGQPPVPTCPF